MSAEACGCDEEAGWLCERENCRSEYRKDIQDGFHHPSRTVLPAKEIHYSGPGATLPVSTIAAKTIQTFDSGATRNLDYDKFDYEGFLNPDVLHAFATYMHGHRRQKDGSLRASDNWQKGIPRAVYMKSLIRHSIDLWRWHRGYTPINPDTGEAHTGVDLCCAVMFNIMGLLKELLHPAGEGL